MQFGWVDFSKKERDRVLNVIAAISERGTLDELGISPIRDGFSDYFFPGSSTIQTRAKYFVILPLIFATLEKNSSKTSKHLEQDLKNLEKDYATRLLQNPANKINGELADGIIGSRTLLSSKYQNWVARSPSEIYWAGLRSYQIFNATNNLSITEYLHKLSNKKINKNGNDSLGNANDKENNGSESKNDDEFNKDDTVLTSSGYAWILPKKDIDSWNNKNVSIELNKEEAIYLKNRIISSHPDSFYALCLNQYRNDFLKCTDFKQLKVIINKSDCSKELKKAYKLAVDFSNFNYTLRLFYNDIVYKHNYEYVKSELAKVNLQKVAQIDLHGIFELLNIKQDELKNFLLTSKNYMLQNNIEALENEIKRHELKIKNSEKRAKTYNPKSVCPTDKSLIGGSYLDYRFGNVKQIIMDIDKGENSDV